MSVVAITGGTGFVGGHLIRRAWAQGYGVRALARRPQPDREGVEWIAGSLDDKAALARLVAGADAVIHVAGVINAADRAGFAAGNITGTEAMAGVAHAAGVGRFIHVSSLAAREPDLSDYGWSKAQSEAVVRGSMPDWTIVRPPAVYGSGDREMLQLFRLAQRGVVPLPPAGRLSLIAVQDLCGLLLALVRADGARQAVYEPDDGVAGGWSHRDFALALGDAVGRRVCAVAVPAVVLRGASVVEGLTRGGRAKLTADRVRYFCHPDWVVAPERRPPPTLWRPRIDTLAGLAATARAYREAGWL